MHWQDQHYPWKRWDNFGCNTPESLASLLGVNGLNISWHSMDINADENPVKGSDYFAYISFGRNGSQSVLSIGFGSTTVMTKLWVKSNKNTSWHYITLS